MEPVRKDMELLSNSMATYAHVKANPESFALYFMMGVCFGLLMALCLLIASIACRSGSPPTARKPPLSSERRKLKESIEVYEDEDEEEDSDVEEEGAPADVSKVEMGTMRSINVFSSADELEKARRLEERERIVREIWRNGQPDVLVNGTGTIGRVHYH